MTNRFPRWVRSDRDGQTLAIVAVSMVALLALLSLGIDLGMAYTARAEAQRVADATALAGASAFLDHIKPADAVGDARARAEEYAEMNFVRNRRVVADEPEVMIWVIPDSQKVRARVQRTGLPVWFARLIGRTELTVSAIAAAHAVAAGSHSCVKPFAIPDRWEENSGDDFNNDSIMNFDNRIPCSGQGPTQGCQVNEVWTFDEAAGDVYRPASDTTIASTSATSWGSQWLDPTGRDAGARLLISPQYALQTGDPGWYQYWQMPESGSTCPSKGTNCLKENIQSCINLEDLGIGDSVSRDGDLLESEENAQPTPGDRGKPVYDAIRTLLNQDPDIYWDGDLNAPAYPAGHGGDPWESPRVITVLLVHPADIRSGASHNMRIMDFATLFLEDPLEVYGTQGVEHQKPITGRLLQYGSGQLGPDAGVLQKVLRLIE
jgi:hypothetical protein